MFDDFMGIRLRRKPGWGTRIAAGVLGAMPEMLPGLGQKRARRITRKRRQ